MKKKLLIALILVAVLGIAAIFAGGAYLVDFAIVRSDTLKDIAPKSAVTQEDASVIQKNQAAIHMRKEAWLSEAVAERTTIQSEDGLTLVGEISWNDPSSHKWLLGVHGYMSKKEDYQGIASIYAEQGFNVLLPDMRSHGESEGKYIGMGWLERKDVLRWIDVIIGLDPQAEIILHGTSMGGAAVMMTAGEALPANVKGIVEDCGYTSAWDIFADELQYLFGLPTFPLLHASSIVSRVLAGYHFTEASAVDQVAKASVPMLFIHGGEDNFVRTEMVYEVYDACQTEKELLVIEGAGHGQAYAMDPELYFDTVFGFIKKHCIAQE